MSPEPVYDTVDISPARAHLIAALARLDALDGRRLPRGEGRGRSAALAEVGKELIFVDHLCAMAKVLVLDEYHLSRGYEGPRHATEAVTYTVKVTPTEEDKEV